MKHSLLIVNDITTYGRVSTFAMYPFLANYGLHPYFLPTAVVSNTLDYGSAEILDTSEWMERAISKWKELGFSFDIIATGLINSSRQVEIVSKLIDEHRPTLVVVDPIMADSGELYPDMYESVVDCNRMLASKADLLIPNYTEACMLSGLYNDRISLNDEEYSVILNALYKLGCRSVVIKGCKDANGNKFNLVSEGPSIPYKKEYYDEIPSIFIGTGDIFSAVLIANVIKGSSLVDSVNIAADVVRTIIIKNSANADHYDLNIESYLKDIFK